MATGLVTFDGNAMDDATLRVLSADGKRRHTALDVGAFVELDTPVTIEADTELVLRFDRLAALDAANTRLADPLAPQLERLLASATLTVSD